MINTIRAFIFEGVNNLIKYCIINAYYKDTPIEDICSSLTGVKAIHWISQPEVCEEFIVKHIRSITTTIFCAYGLLLLFAFLIYIPFDAYRGTKSVVFQLSNLLIQLCCKLLGLQYNNQDLATKNDKEEKKRIREQANNTKERNAKKNGTNARLADDLVRFLTKLKHLQSMQQLVVLLQSLQHDTVRELDDERKKELQCGDDNVIPTFLQIKND